MSTFARELCSKISTLKKVCYADGIYYFVDIETSVIYVYCGYAMTMLCNSDGSPRLITDYATNEKLKG